jgi:hypothetical protein
MQHPLKFQRKILSLLIGLQSFVPFTSPISLLIRIKSYLLSNDASRLIFNTISHEQYAQIISVNCLLYILYYTQQIYMNNHSLEREITVAFVGAGFYEKISGE